MKKYKLKPYTFFNIKQLRPKGLFVLSLLLVLVLCNGCAHGSKVRNYPLPWKFAVISDTQGNKSEIAGHPGINKSIIRSIARDIAAERPDFVLVAGDLVNGWIRNSETSFSAQYRNWKLSMEEIYNAGIPVFPVRGNHDAGPERVALPPLPPRLEPAPGALILLEQTFKENFSEPYIPGNGPEGEEGFTFSFIHKNAFIAGLDVCGNHQHKVNQEWLDKEFAQLNKTRLREQNVSDLAAVTEDNPKNHEKLFHVFAFAHEPAFQLKHKDCLAFYKKNRDDFWDSLGKAGGKVYFCGHDHLYNRAIIADSTGNEIQQIVVGTGGGHLVQWSGSYSENTRVKGQYSSSEYHGYLLVTIDGPRATVVWKALIRQDKNDIWQILDSFSYILPSYAGRS